MGKRKKLQIFYTVGLTEEEVQANRALLDKEIERTEDKIAELCDNPSTGSSQQGYIVITV